MSERKYRVFRKKGKKKNKFQRPIRRITMRVNLIAY